MTRQAHYLFVADLVLGKVVLEVGTGDGSGARFLAEHGAARVIGIDTDAAVIAAARARHSLSNLELRQESPARIELEDASVDCVFAPDGARMLRRRGVLAELRRVLAPGGSLIVSAAAAERPGGGGGATYHALVEHLSPLFAPVHMVAHAPLHAAALVGFGAPSAPSDAEEIARVVLDRSLADGPLTPTEYLAVCGAAELALDALTLIELPGAISREVTVVTAAADAVPRAVDVDERTERVSDRGIDPSRLVSAGPPEVPAGPTASELIAAALEQHAVHTRELEAVIAEARAEAEELAEELARERAAGVERDRAIETERARAERLARELAEARDRAARAEGQVLRLEAGRSDTDQRTGELADRLSRVESRRAELERNLEEAEEARASLEARVALAEAAADDMRRALTEVPRAGATGEPTDAAPGAGRGGPFGLAALRRVEAELAAVRALLEPLEAGLLELEAGLAHADPAAGDDDRRLRQMAIEIGVKDAELTLLNIGLSTLQRRLRDAVDTARATRTAMQDRSAAEMLALMDGLQRALSALA